MSPGGRRWYRVYVVMSRVNNLTDAFTTWLWGRHVAAEKAARRG